MCAISPCVQAGMKKLGTMSALGTLADFDDFSAFDGDAEVFNCSQLGTEIQEANMTVEYHMIYMYMIKQTGSLKN